MNARKPCKRPVELGLMFTHRCPIECRHCGIMSGPDNHSSMDDDLVEYCIDQAAHLDPRPLTIVFTGGEPMMYPARLERFLERCNALGFATRVITSGFWAKTPETGRHLIYRLRLAGLDALNFSADKYHLEFLEPVVLRNAIDLAWEAGLVVIVNMVTNETDHAVEEFSALYGIPANKIRLFSEAALLRDVADGREPRDLSSVVNLAVGNLVGMGRAAQYPSEFRNRAVHEFGMAPCHEVVNRPVIYPDGSLQACCCAGGKLETFYVGSVKQRPLTELFAMMQSRSHFQFINKFGPRALFEAMTEMTPDVVEPSRRYPSICDVCVAATCKIKPEQVDMLLQHWGLKRILEFT